ncbi:MAG: AmmeMemoRadiSam system protein B [Candidatus Aenigmarchaeota archaeon]|nr:AmmeMemoRadiSam system protein B [Candidatus Aenigmarchaeota archaeon]
MRFPSVADSFYSGDKENLQLQLKAMFSKLKTKSDCRAVISPHAGYTYSGQTAAFAINSLKPSDRFAIIGLDHSSMGPEFAINTDTWETPLGQIETVKLKSPFLEEDDMIGEHSIEVQLPFIQYRFPKAKIIPISLNQSFSEEFMESCIELGRFLSKEKLSLVASSDFSHQVPLKVAERKDGLVLEKIKQLDVRGLFQVIEDNKISVCGFGPIAVALSFAKELNLRPEIIHSSNSGNVIETGFVVTYYAIGFK